MNHEDYAKAGDSLRGGNPAGFDGPGAGEAQAPPEQKPVTPLKVQVVFSEFEGEKKISSLPYTFFVNAEDRPSRHQVSLRMGLRVPVMTGAKESNTNFQYIDIGTDIDCSAEGLDDGRFRLALTVRRSAVHSGASDKKPPSENAGEPQFGPQPIVRSFSSTLDLLLRNGQTIQSTVATEPISGRILKIDVTAWAVE